MSNKQFYSLVAVFILASTLFWIYMFQGQSFALPFADDQTVDTEGITLTMYHSEGCQCCVKWAEYLEDNGMEVVSKKVDNLYEIKEKHGVSGQLSSCHTGIVDGYVVEGHVPIEDIRRLLNERPEAIGISAPGMPPNSPGMDMPVDREYQVVLFDNDNNISVYAVHN